MIVSWGKCFNCPSKDVYVQAIYSWKYKTILPLNLQGFTLENNNAKILLESQWQLQNGILLLQKISNFKSWVDSSVEPS